MLPLIAQTLYCACDPSHALASGMRRSQVVVLAPTQGIATAHVTQAPRVSAASTRLSALRETAPQVEAGSAFCPEPADDWLVDAGVNEYPPLDHIIPALSLRSLVTHEDAFPATSPPSLVSLACQLTT